MIEKAYTYSVIRYVHDLAAGERLNIGVVLHCREDGYVGIRYEESFRRLSATFNDFESRLFRDVMRNLETSILSLSRQGVLWPLKDATAVVNHVWPDFGLNYRSGPSSPGVTTSPLPEVLDKLFDRFVVSQARIPKERRSRSDDDIWSNFRRQAERRDIFDDLKGETIETNNFHFKFDHTLRNGRLHIVAPLSFDLKEEDAIRDKALRWIGNGQVLQGLPDLGRFLFLVGKPNLPEQIPAFETAVAWLNTVQLEKSIYFEDEPNGLVQELEEIRGGTRGHNGLL